MDVAEAIYSHLTTDSTITALNSTRVYPLVKADQVQFITPSYIVYQKLSSSHPFTFGLSLEVKSELWQFDIYYTGYSELVSLSSAIITSLNAKQGTIPVGVSPAYEFELIELESEVQTYEDTDNLYHAVLTFRFHYS